MAECINCDACLRHCPPQLGAIFNHGIDVIIIPELCSGCDKCLDPCPVDCIYPDPTGRPRAKTGGRSKPMTIRTPEDDTHPVLPGCEPWSSPGGGPHGVLVLHGFT